MTGSPPRMRGKPHMGKRQIYNKRITPAHAGKTAPHRQAVLREADHPRACGENYSSGVCLGGGCGSPPRMRGKLSGNQIIIASIGSPPRMRGKPKARQSASKSPRITPAHAGKTTVIYPTPQTPPDHPRACGENCPSEGLNGIYSGSPPRMRGKLLRQLLLRYGQRITPAHAGKTGFYRQPVWKAADHPRACGENTQHGIRHSIQCGSPPRMRGKHNAAHQCYVINRITPAHAGKTS